MDKKTELGIYMVLCEKGLEKAIKEMLDTNKKYRIQAKDKYIKENGEELGNYHNEISYSSFQLSVIATILSYRGLYEDRKHIKTLCDEIRIIADDLEKLVKEEDK